MIREGKQAKVTYAKHGEVISPVGEAVLCNESRMSLKAVNCKSVSEDITLQALFPDKK